MRISSRPSRVQLGRPTPCSARSSASTFPALHAACRSLVSFGTMIAYALLGVEDTRNDPDYDYSAWTEAILNVTATGKAVVASALRLG